MIIGINGKIGSGKDTIGKIIQYLVANTKHPQDKPSFNILIQDKFQQQNAELISGVKIKKFADKLKDIVCLLINCTREQLEDADFKNKELGEEWWYYKTKGLGNKYTLRPYGDNTILSEDLPIYNERYLIRLTPRLLLQLLGTDCGRDIIHPNTWVNSLMNEYKSNLCNDGIFCTMKSKDGNTLSWIPDPILEPITYPNWIITDTRFLNELEAIKKRGGISIRVNRENKVPCNNCQGGGCTTCNGYGYWIAERQNEHESETALDNATFDYTIDNNNTIEELIEKVKEILIKEKIIK